MLSLVRRARRRLFSNELLAQGANAASAALVAFILLLLVGTQILSWQLALVIPLAAAAVGLYRARKRLPSPYSVAQLIDRRMSLADTLSTAFYFNEEQSSAPAGPEVRQLQHDLAERMAADVDVRKAVPYTMPRTVYVMAALVLVATSLFALRYGLNRTLDLKPPLANILQQTFGTNERVEQARNNNHKMKQPEPETEPDGSGEKAQDPDQKAPEQPDSEAANASEEAADPKAQQADSKQPGGDAKNKGDEGEKADGDQKDTQDQRSGEGENPTGKPSDKSDPKQDGSNKQDSNNSGDNSSLMSKVKDAVQNLLSRMKPQQGQTGQQQQQAADQKGNQSKAQQNGSKQQAGKDGQQQQEGGQQGDAQEGQAGEQAQNSQDPQGKGTGKSDNPQPSKQPGSGVGSQDGDKSIKQAEQLAAMGKISEIFGKRSATITGEATVEVQNTSQNLRTPYAQRSGQHTQGGAEITRDEIPVALQPYVEQYFEQMRKQPAKKQ